MNKHDQYFRNKLNDYLHKLKFAVFAVCIIIILSGTFYIGHSSKEFFCTPNTVYIDTLSDFYKTKLILNNLAFKHSLDKLAASKTVYIDTLSSFYESRRLADSTFSEYAKAIMIHDFIHNFPK